MNFTEQTIAIPTPSGDMNTAILTPKALGSIQLLYFILKFFS